MKLILKRAQQRARSDDSGMTLIEVIVAISLIGIVATAAIGLGITSEKGASSQQRQELAVTVANEAMELVSAQSSATNPTTGASYLYQGRTEAKVEAAWALNAGIDGLAATYPGWDRAATSTSDPKVAISRDVTRSGTKYTVFSLIGSCYIARVGGGNCWSATGDATLTSNSRPPTTAPTGKIQINRVLVVVRWTAGSGCSTNGCTYVATSLVDAHSDLQWNTHG
ncbi:type IV pilus modification PilV family protein [Leifsonia sp. A12D58]|uniref:type IV pilus modification PilV family protein n=1 Tax=Leifsonia sp. A12D58 TaxID=3397674 RepID=UPI0039E086AE